MNISHLIRQIEKTPQTILSFILAFTTIIILRLLVEAAMGSFAISNFETLFFEFSHTYLFFLFAFSLFLPLLAFFTKEHTLATTNILLFGFFIILAPPIIDTFLFGQNGYWSFYIFDSFTGLIHRYMTFFGDSPSIGITSGVRIEVFIMTCLSIFLIRLKTLSIIRALVGGVAVYSLFFLLGTFPSWLTFALEPTTFLKATGSSVAALFLTPENILSRDVSSLRSVLNMKMSLWYAFLNLISFATLFYAKNRTHWLALYRNARFPQVFYHGGLVALGGLLAFYFEDLALPHSHFSYLAFLLLTISAVFAWLTSVVVNDCYDTAIDQKTNPNRPLITEAISQTDYQAYAILFFCASLLLAGVVSAQALLLIFGYQALAWVYSATPFRLKRFPLIATLTASFASFLILATGYLAVSELQSLKAFPLPLLLFLIVSFTIALPLKDFKDIAGDKHDGVYTLPVILGELWAKRVLGLLVFILFVLSPFILNASSLYVPALLFGSTAFWIIQSGTAKPTAFFRYTRFSLFFFLLVFCYGLFIALHLS